MKYALIPLAVAVTIAGVARPEFAGRGAQLLIACTVASLVATAVQSRWNLTEPQVAGPFVPAELLSTSGTETSDVTELVRAVEGSDGRIPPPISKHLVDACRGRLVDHHRLQIRNTADQPRIQGLISSELWGLVSAVPEDVVDLPIRLLPRLLDEVNAL